VQLQELSTTLLEIVRRPALALVDTAFQARALPGLAIVAARLLFVAPRGADVRPPVPCVGVLRGSAAPARAAFRIAAPSRSRLFSKNGAHRMSYTLGQAAKAVGMSKTSILRSIKAGRISAGRDELGQWAIEPCELHRVYPPLTDDTG